MRFQINNLSFYFKKLEEVQIKSKASKRKGIINARLEINKIKKNDNGEKSIKLKLRLFYKR